MNRHRLSKEEIFKLLGTGTQGLSAVEAEEKADANWS